MALARDMFTHTLTVLARARGLARIAVVSTDDEVLQLARTHGAWAIWETHPGLNEALEQATRVALANGISGVLILPADLPELTAHEVEQLLARGVESPCVVISPAQRDDGTNALLVNPAGLLHYAFGPSSFAEHTRRAELAGARVEILRSAGLAYDLDLPEDWQRLYGTETKT